MQKRKIRIFIVHPQLELAQAYKKRLELGDFAVTVFKDHDEALAYMQHVDPDLLIIGELLNSIDAAQFLDILENSSLAKGTPVLVITEGSYSTNTYKDGSYIPKTAASSATVINKINHLLGLTSTRR